MAKLIRIDAELVRRGLADSRAHAQELIADSRVYVDRMLATKPARQIDPAQAIVVKDADEDHWASRGAYKLLGALDYLGDSAPQVTGVRALDAGASTGGFTDVLLSRGAKEVIAVDVGQAQLRQRLAQDPRVIVMDKTNVRYLQPEMVAPAPSLIVSDLSFISLTMVIPALARVAASDADFLLMVKPQFEVGKDKVGAGGVVRDTKLHAEAIASVVQAAREAGLALKAVAPSPLPGPAGNVEYFVYVKAGAADAKADQPQAIDAAIQAAIAAGPAGCAGAAGSARSGGSDMSSGRAEPAEQNAQRKGAEEK